MRSAVSAGKPKLKRTRFSNGGDLLRSVSASGAIRVEFYPQLWCGGSVPVMTVYASASSEQSASYT